MQSYGNFLQKISVQNILSPFHSFFLTLFKYTLTYFATVQLSLAKYYTTCFKVFRLIKISKAGTWFACVRVFTCRMEKKLPSPSFGKLNER